MKDESGTSYLRGVLLSALLMLLFPSCALFETREPEPPTQIGSDFRNPTGPDIVITNLQSAIAQRNLQNYISCFSNPDRSPRGFTFISNDAIALAQYSTLSSWSYDKEKAYMENLISFRTQNGFSNLLLTLRTTSSSSDSVVYLYDYTFTFEHTDNGFPHTTALGSVQFTIAPDNTSYWSIIRWVDIPTSSSITWSAFRGRFSPR